MRAQNHPHDFLKTLNQEDDGKSVIKRRPLHKLPEVDIDPVIRSYRRNGYRIDMAARIVDNLEG
jgi:hypothetical protein